ncbi:efflux RND transporter periplasmic adaptor subunit [Aliikangiella coralliicola]|uniref:Efflux RND transporter periplasmic adaptor subunit n=1 Tax=Aliikangiella coralliicola TaxID=2592383 RepID=A0A545UIS6_9GAMM|nr:efflux RND transporter periplasmic adaptor subunit [Aliikangiella coralliicola]TQV89366.1 efflux RND transporter periplasmic adaptor subunit [Aliikangiella coralliicola]
MDRKIEAKKYRFNLLVVIGAIVFIIGAWWAIAGTDFSGNFLKVEKQRLRISEVKHAVLEDYIPVRGQVKPSRSVYLDAIEGGRVEEVLIEEGAEVKAGDIILRLSNTNLQLDVISREAQVSEQLNNLRNTRLAIDQATLNLKSEIVEIDYQLTKLKRSLKQKKRLFARKLISEDDYLATKDEVRYFEQRKALVIERQATDKLVRKVQLEQLENSVAQLQKNLKVARKNLENLNVKAPVSGKLTALNVELGESKARGQRLGQVDKLDSFKVSALVDEFYIARLQKNQVARAKANGENFQLTVSKIYSQVSSGQFEIELKFEDKTPGNIRRGQTIQMKLELADGENALVIDKGGFIQDTGGNWIFVVNQAGTRAVKRSIRSGRSNPDYVEIVDGLQPGERVVVSSYGNYEDIQQLIFN